MKKSLLICVLLALALSGCDPDWWKPKSAAAPAMEIALSCDEIWTRLTPHGQISVSGNGTSGDPYVYNVPMSLNLNGHNIAVHGWQGAGSLGPGVCAVFHVNGSITGGGSIDVCAQNRSGGKLTLAATGGVSVQNLSTGGGAASSALGGGSTNLSAAGSTNPPPGKESQGGELTIDVGGAVQVGGYINTAGTASGGDVKIQCAGLSIGQYNNCSIFCSAAESGAGNWLIHSKAPRAGNVTIDCSGPVTLAGGISASGGTGGSVVIRGSQSAVHVGGDIDIASRASGSQTTAAGIGRAKLSVAADSLFVGGNVLANGQAAPGGEIDVAAAGDCRIHGYVRTDSSSAASGRVLLRGRHIWIEGSNSAAEGANSEALPPAKGQGGWSINARPGSARDGQKGDGDVILQCLDTSQLSFDPSNPMSGSTSSVFVASRILTGYMGPNLLGQVYIEGVEVALGGDVQTSAAQERTLEIHYGTSRFGYAHLTERGQRWDGGARHDIRYGAAIPEFLPDVAYAGAGR